jgi:hypothetical protein
MLKMEARRKGVGEQRIKEGGDSQFPLLYSSAP